MLYDHISVTGTREKYREKYVAYFYFKQHYKDNYKVGPDQYWIFGADTDTDIRKQESFNIQYICLYYIHIILAKCG